MKRNRLRLAGRLSQLLFAAAVLLGLRQSLPAVGFALRHAAAAYLNLPFSPDKLLARQYGELFELVRLAASSFPRGLYPRVRRGVEIFDKAAVQILRIPPYEPNARRTNAIYVVYGIPPEHIDKLFPIVANPAGEDAGSIHVPAATPVEFVFTVVRMSRSGTVMFDSIDTVSLPAETAPGARLRADIHVERVAGDFAGARLLGSTSATGRSGSRLTLSFAEPLKLYAGDVLKRYRLTLISDSSWRLFAVPARNPKHELTVGARPLAQKEPACLIAGRLVDTRGYVLLSPRDGKGLVYGSETMVRETGVTPPLPQTDYAKIGAYLEGELRRMGIGP